MQSDLLFTAQAHPLYLLLLGWVGGEAARVFPVLYLIRKTDMNKKNERGSIELIVLALLGALIIVLAIPLLGSLGQNVYGKLQTLNDNTTS